MTTRSPLAAAVNEEEFGSWMDDPDSSSLFKYSRQLSNEESKEGSVGIG
jgi:hypothetical protein